MAEATSGSDLFNDLAYEFAERYRRGERPSLNEYADRYPHLADEIRELFPTLVMMERVGSEADGPQGSVADRPRRDRPMPERLGDYRILREIGRGGMGVVYEAVQESLGRPVALKVLSHDRESGPIALIRFRREARTASLLHHTNIVPVFGVGEHEGVPYYAMQYIQGRGLDAVLRDIALVRRRADKERRRPRGAPDRTPPREDSERLTRRYRDPSHAPAGDQAASPVATEPGSATAVRAASASTSSILARTELHSYRDVARMAMQAAEALAYAHGHGVVHRDIKPANLLLDVQGTIWVTDFGLARTEGSDDLTNPGDIVGTLRYVAPERFRGQADVRSDIYSLGLTLYELLTLEPAYRSSHRVQLMHAILHDEPARPRKLDRRIPRDLETIVLKAIAKDPADRFADAGEMAAELGRFIEGLPIRSRRLAVSERIWRWSRRNPALAVLSLLATVLTVALLIGSVAAAWTYRDQRDAVRFEQSWTAANLRRAQSAERQRRAELGRSLVLQARAERLSGQPGRRAAALGALTKAAGIARDVGASPEDLANLRDEVIAALALPDDGVVQNWPGVKLSPEAATFSIVADRCVRLGPDGAIHVHRLSDGSEIRVVGAGRPAARVWPVYVPGGRFLYVVSGSSEIELWDLERGERPAAWPDDVRCITARSDGGQVAALRPDGELRIYDLPAMTEAARLQLEIKSPRRIPGAWLSLSEDGRYLAAIRGDAKDARASIYDVASGRVVRDLPAPSARVDRGLALDRSGKLLAISHDRAISVYDAADGEVLARLQGHQSEGIIAQFQPGGGLLVSKSWDGTTRLWDPIRGQMLATIPGDYRDWTVDGTGLAVVSQQDVAVHRIAGGDERRTIDCRALSDRAGAALYGPARVAFSPDGRLIAMALRPEGVRIARASDGAGLAHLPIGHCDEVLFLADGSLLTVNGRGLCRWPVRRGAGAPSRIGPPEPLAAIDLPAEFVNSGLAADAGGHLVGAISLNQRGPLLLDPDRPRRRTWLLPQWGVVVHLAISPDGRWAATGGRDESPYSREVHVWDVATARVVARLPVGHARVAFSPDGRWLGVGGSGRYQFFRTGSWTPGREVPHGHEGGLRPMAFHPGGRIAALLDASGSIVRLVEVETGRLLASLDAPDQTPTYCLAFSPDGRVLAVSQTDQRVHLWDLALIRRRLEDLGLATGLPADFGGAPTGDVPAVERIEVVGADRAGLRLLAIRQILRRGWFAFRGLFDPGLHDALELRLRGECWERMGHWRLAAADYRASLARQPDLTYTAYVLARCLVSRPGRGDPAEAVQWAQRAVAVRPGEVVYHQVLGAALYRAGRFVEAAAELESNIPRNPDRAGIDWLFLAMSRQRLGQGTAARAALAEAARWRVTRPALSRDQAATFERFLHEAESVLEGTIPDRPADGDER